MYGIKFESFVKFILECKTFIHTWVYLFATNVLFEYKGGLIIDHDYATKDSETWFVCCPGWMVKNNSYVGYMYELLIPYSNLGLPHIHDVDRTFAIIVQYMVTGVKFGTTNPVT